MRLLNWLAVFAILLTLSTLARADDAPIAPFIDSQTLLVIRVDVSAVDFKTLCASVETSVKASDLPADDYANFLKSLPDLQTNAQRWADEFKQAGGKQIYLELNLETVNDSPVIIVPLADGADSAAIENLFSTSHAKMPLDETLYGNCFALSHGCMLFTRNTRAMSKIRERQAVARPELAKTLAEAGDAPIRLAFIPSEDAKTELRSKHPQFPPGLAGVETADLLRDLTSGYGSISMAPVPMLRLVMHYKDATSAATARAAAAKCRDIYKNLHEEIKNAVGATDDMPWDSAIPLFLIGADGNDMVLTIFGEKLTSFATDGAIGLTRADITARRVRSAGNLRAIAQAIRTYANANKGAYPMEFASILNTKDIEQARLYLDPVTGNQLPENWEQMTGFDQRKWINENSDYMYLGAGLKDGADHLNVVAYEKPSLHTADIIIILFADGHVENQTPGEAKKSLEHSKSLREKP